MERAGGRPGSPALGGIVVRPDDPVEMLYTSGTTGEPKGCLLSHGNMYYKCRVYMDLHRWTHADRYLVPVPYFHIFGSMGGVAANCLAGSTQVVMEVFDAGEAMRLIEAERVTIFSGVPTMFITMLGHPAFGHARSLARCGPGSIGAAPVPVEIMRRILDRERGPRAWTPWWCTGSPRPPGARTGRAPGDPHREAGGHGRGCARRRSRTACVDPATGRPLPPGQEGEVCIKGPTLMLGYYKKPEATAEKVRDGWLHTGDMGSRTRTAIVRITGPLTDMIIVGGFNTYPAEIEDFFLRHPRVLDVSIVGVPDPVMGEAVMAFVIPKDGATLAPEDDRRLRARDQIANFKLPRYVEIVDQFPLTGSGKVQKFKQKAYAVEKYDLEGPSPGGSPLIEGLLPDLLEHPERHAQEGGHHVRIEVGARRAPDLDRAPPQARWRFRVGPVEGHGVEGVGDREDAGAEGDGRARETRADSRCRPSARDGGGPPGSRAQERDLSSICRPISGWRPHDHPLRGRERAGLEEDRVGDADLADVVQEDAAGPSASSSAAGSPCVRARSAASRRGRGGSAARVPSSRVARTEPSASSVVW